MYKIKHLYFIFILFLCIIFNKYDEARGALVEMPGDSPHFDIKIADKVLHNIFGFGVQIDQGDDRAEQVIKDLKLKYVRVEVGPTWVHINELPETGADQSEVDAYVARNFNFDYANRLANAEQIWNMAKKYNFKIILNFFDIPGDWIDRRDGDNRDTLKKENVKDFGKLWLGIIRYLSKHQLIPDFLELANEPDGDWNGCILPEHYDELIQFVRQGLNTLELEAVGIIGPGLSNLEKEDRTKLQIKGLSIKGVNSLTAWSTHTWDEWHDQDEEQSHNLMSTQWEVFRSIIKEKDHMMEKPIFVTEYSSAAIKYFGTKYSMYREEGVPLAINTHYYARRVYQNTLLNMNYGANVQIIWTAAGQDWDDKFFGLISKPAEGSKKRPLYSSLMTLVPYIPSMSQVLETTHNEEMEMVITAVKSDKRLIIGISNPMPFEQFADIDLSAFKVKAVEESIRHQMNVIGTAQMNIKTKGTILETKMPADTTTTIVIRLL